MKLLLLLCLSLNLWLPLTAQHHVNTVPRSDSSRAIRFYIDSLNVTDAQAKGLFRIEYEFRSTLWAALRDSGTAMPDRQNKMKENLQKRDLKLEKLLTPEQLERLRHLVGKKALGARMNAYREAQVKEREARYIQRRSTIGHDSTNHTK